MLNSNHPDDERLSALASHDADATADTTLTAHVSSCDRCTDLVNELGALRLALADLPDVAPARPLQLVPPVEAVPVPAVDRLGGWARRFFAPALAAGAALVMVGTIGTAVPAFNGMAASGGAATDAGAPATQENAAEPAVGASGIEETARTADGDAADAAAPGAAAPSVAALSSSGGGAVGDSFTSAAVSPAPTADEGGAALGLDQNDGETPVAALSAERSPWPMVLFAGVALMIAALLGRWILAPRAG